MKIIVDAMGGDNAPLEIVKGALLGMEHWGVEVLLTGDTEAILRALRDCGHDTIPRGMEIVHTTETVEMCDDPSKVFRHKKDTSMGVGLTLLRDGKADALVSAGSTGALLAGATLITKRIRGIRRAAMAPVIPTTGGKAVLIDCGANAECPPEYLLQFGFRLIDQRDVPGRILWECEANELLEDSYRLDEYARIHAPLMCMQYPYVKYQRNVPFKVNQKTYNYTGLSYDIDRMEQIADVDKNSPAYAAGLRPRDIVEKINDQKMNYTAEEFSAAYKGFITNTMKYRDPKTQFTDANGFKRCMFWDTFKYSQVADAIQKPGNKTTYSYLYYYAPYINPSGNNACTFDIKRGKNKMEIIVRPTIRRSVTVEVK